MTGGPNPLFASRAAPFWQPHPHAIDLPGRHVRRATARNGEVCYGPNLGHGRFGAKVTMDCKLGGAHIRPVGKRSVDPTWTPLRNSEPRRLHSL